MFSPHSIIEHGIMHHLELQAEIVREERLAQATSSRPSALHHVTQALASFASIVLSFRFHFREIFTAENLLKAFAHMDYPYLPWL